MRITVQVDSFQVHFSFVDIVRARKLQIMKCYMYIKSEYMSLP